MLDNPPAALLVAEVRKLLDAGAPPGFAQRVGANALGIALREMEQGPAQSAAEAQRLSGLVGSDASLAALNAKLAIAIREGGIGADNPDLLDHLIRTSIEKIAVDQPAYPAFRQWQAKAAGAP